LTRNDTLVADLSTDYNRAELSPADRAMLDYAAKLTRSPAQMRADDVENLTRHGFSESAVLDICQVAAYMAYVNRMADGLGVELENEQV
jgi:uncharacterized peroxidase-related enzyme